MAKKPQKQPAKRKPGRQEKKLSEEDYKKVEALAARGMVKKDIAHCIGIGNTTLYKLQNDDPKFAEAIERGVAAGIAAVTGALLKQINVGNITGIIFYLKTRAGWNETIINKNYEMPPLPDDGASDEDLATAYHNTMQTIK